MEIKPVKLLFICLGNICRSPSAEAVMNAVVEREGLANKIICDSAGTAGYHSGEPADARSIAAGKRRGYNLTSISRKLYPFKDFEEFDMIITMDDANYVNVKRLEENGELANKLCKMCDFCISRQETEVPDPYYDSESGFENVLDLLEDACTGLLAEVRKRYKI